VLDLTFIYFGMAQISITSFSMKLNLCCVVLRRPQLRPQITGPNGERNTGVVLYIYYLGNENTYGMFAYAMICL